MKKNGCFFTKLRDEFEWLSILIIFVLFVLSGWYLHWSFIIFYPQIKEFDVSAVCLTLWGSMNLLCILFFCFSLLLLVVLCVNIFKLYRKYIKKQREEQ